MAKQKVAMLTAGGLAPCLSSAVGGLIERYSDVAPEIELVNTRIFVSSNRFYPCGGAVGQTCQHQKRSVPRAVRHEKRD